MSAKKLRASRHFVRYDAQTYAEQGFLERGGRVGDMASRKPRYWQVSATCRTQDPTTGEQMKHRFTFMGEVRARLSELSATINERIHQEDDYLPDCLSVMVVARIMTEDGR